MHSLKTMDHIVTFKLLFLFLSLIYIKCLFETIHLLTFLNLVVISKLKILFNFWYKILSTPKIYNDKKKNINLLYNDFK